MKKSTKFLVLSLVLFILIGLPLMAGGKKEKMSADYDLASMSWDEIVEQAKKEGSVTHYAWYWKEHWDKMAADFEKEYGIKAVVVVGDETSNFNKVVAEAKLPSGTVDAMNIGGKGVKIAFDENLFYGPLKDIIPNSKYLDKNLLKFQEGVVTNGFFIPQHRNQTGFAYNPDTVKNPPQTWAEFEKWIDDHPKQFGFNDPNKGGSGQSMVHTLIKQLAGGLEKYEGDTDVDMAKVKDWDNVWNWLKDRKDRIVFTSSNADSIVRMNDGELDLIVAWDDDLLNKMKQGVIFDKVKMYIPEFGLAGGGDTFGILNNAPHKAAAAVWINFLTDKAQQQAMSDGVGAYPARDDIANTKTNLTTADRKYALAWFPAAYKKYMIEQFTKQVLMSK